MHAVAFCKTNVITNLQAASSSVKLKGARSNKVNYSKNKLATREQTLKAAKSLQWLISSSAMFSCPWRAAWWSGVLPSVVWDVIFAPCWNINRYCTVTYYRVKDNSIKYSKGRTFRFLRNGRRGDWDWFTCVWCFFHIQVLLDFLSFLIPTFFQKSYGLSCKIFEICVITLVRKFKILEID